MKKLLVSLLCVVMVVCFMPAMAWADDDIGAQADTAWGSNYDTVTEFTISNEAELRAFAAMVNEGKNFSGKTVKLANDITMSSENWVPIGSINWTDSSDADSGDNFFAGIFDGQKHVISGISTAYGRTDEEPLYDAAGLFGVVSGTVKDVSVVNLSLIGAYDYIGGIAGTLIDGAVISGCSVQGSISGAVYTGTAEGSGEFFGSQLGGIVGRIELSTTNATVKIEDCINEADVEGSSEVGGIVGEIKLYTSNATVKIEDCINEADVKGSTNVGGIVGDAGGNNGIKNITVQTCVNKGSIQGDGLMGGVAGDATGTLISDCANEGSVTGGNGSSSDKKGVGGIVGDTVNTEIKNCRNTADVCGTYQMWVGGIAGRLYSGSSVSDSSNTGDVQGKTKVGGVVGYGCSDSLKNYDVSDCENAGSVTGDENVGGIVGEAQGSPQQSVTPKVENCTNSGAISGTKAVGGIVGNHNADYRIGTSSVQEAAVVTGCVNTGAVPEGSGAIVGVNNSPDDQAGVVQNNFWAVDSVGSQVSAVASGAGSSSDADAVKNNSSYSADGTLTTTVTDEKGNDITTIAGAVENLLGGSNNASDVLKATASFDQNGHGDVVSSTTVVIGGTVTLPTLSKVGNWTFTGWTAGGKTYNGGDSVTLTADTTFTAQWRDDTPYIPSATSVQKPTVETSEGVTASLNSTGTTASITVADGYELVDVTVNGVSKGAVTTLTGLKTGDKVVITAKKTEEPPVVDDAALIESVKNTRLVARSMYAKAPSGKKSIKVYWFNKDGSALNFDGYEVYRSLKKDSGYGTKPIFKTTKARYYNTAIKKGTKYYYKVRAYKVINGEKVYTQYSLKAWRTAK